MLAIIALAAMDIGRQSDAVAHGITLHLAADLDDNAATRGRAPSYPRRRLAPRASA
jgi:hypothetical protein